MSSPELPESFQQLVEKVEGPVSSEDVDTYSKLRQIEDRSHRIRTIVDAWNHQQTEDRALRRAYAKWMAWILGGQLLLLNVVFVCAGMGALKYQRWTMDAFVVSVFGEVVAIVLLVVKYLFPQSTDKILDLLEKLTE